MPRTQFNLPKYKLLIVAFVGDYQQVALLYYLLAYTMHHKKRVRHNIYMHERYR